MPAHLPTALLVVFVTTGVASAQATPLNPPFDFNQKIGKVADFRTHIALPEVLFRVEAREQTRYELYRAPLDGSRGSLPVVALGPRERILDYAFSPNGQWVVFRADLEQHDVFELYAHRVGTPGSRRLSAVGPPGDVQSFEFAGDRVVFLESTVQGGPGQLYSVPLDGSLEPLRLDAESGGGSAFGFSVALATQRVVFTAGPGERVDLYSVPVAGGPPLMLSAGVPVGLEAGFDARISAGGGFVVFKNRSEARLYRVDTDGSHPAVRLDGGVATTAPYTSSFDLAAGARVVFTVQTQAGLEAFTVPADASTPAQRLNPPLGANEYVNDYQLTPDGSRVVFALTDSVARSNRLFSTRSDGVGGLVLLEGDLPNTLGWITLSPDSAHAVYFLFQRNEIHSVPVDGSRLPVRLDDEDGGVAVPTPVAASSGVSPIVISPDSRTVLFAFGEPFQPGYSGQGLYRAPIDGSAAQLAVRERRVVSGFGFDASGAHILFLAERDTGPSVPELFSAATTGGTPVLLSNRLAPGSSDHVYLDSDDEPAFVRGAGTDLVFALNGSELWRNRADGTTAATLLESGNPGLRVLRATPDRSRIVFQRSTGSDSSLWSFSTTDASPVPVPIANGGQGALVLDFALTGDGQRVVYRRQTATGVRLEVTPITTEAPLVLASESTALLAFVIADSRALYVLNFAQLKSVPLDGSAAPITLAQSNSVMLRSLSPDGQRACVAIRSGQPSWGLSVVSVDGSLPPVVLPGEIDPDYELRADLFDPSGTYVLYAAEGSLWRAPADGGSAPVALASVEVPRLVTFTPDGLSLLYISSGDLYRVGLDGSSAPELLSRRQLTIREWPRIDVTLTPDGQSVLYVTASIGVDELWMTSLVSGARRRLSGPLGLEGEVRGAGFEPAFRITPDGSAVVYRADADIDGVFDLYLASLTDAFRPLRLNPPLLGAGATFFDLSLDGRHVIYQGVQDGYVSYSTELFSMRLPRTPMDRHAIRR